MSFTDRRQASVERDECFVPAEGRRKRRREQGAAQAATAAGDVALSPILPTVVIEGSQPGKRCGFFTADLSKLWHPDDEGKRRTFTNAGNAEHQIKPLGQVIIGSQTLGNVAYPRRAPCLQPCNVAGNNTPQPRLIDMLKPCLKARDVLLGLLKEGQMGC